MREMYVREEEISKVWELDDDGSQASAILVRSEYKQKGIIILRMSCPSYAAVDVTVRLCPCDPQKMNCHFLLQRQ